MEKGKKMDNLKPSMTDREKLIELIGDCKWWGKTESLTNGTHSAIG